MNRRIFNSLPFSAVILSLAALANTSAQAQALPQSCSAAKPLYLVPSFAAAASSRPKAACWQTRSQPHSSRASLCCPQSVEKTHAVTPPSQV